MQLDHCQAIHPTVPQPLRLGTSSNRIRLQFYRRKFRLSFHVCYAARQTTKAEKCAKKTSYMYLFKLYQTIYVNLPFITKQFGNDMKWRSKVSLGRDTVFKPLIQFCRQSKWLDGMYYKEIERVQQQSCIMLTIFLTLSLSAQFSSVTVREMIELRLKCRKVP